MKDNDSNNINNKNEFSVFSQSNINQKNENNNNINEENNKDFDLILKETLSVDTIDIINNNNVNNNNEPSNNYIEEFDPNNVSDPFLIETIEPNNEEPDNNIQEKEKEKKYINTNKDITPPNPSYKKNSKEININKENPYELNKPDDKFNQGFNNNNNINNNNNNNNGQNNRRYEHDIKKIKEIIERCKLLASEAFKFYENYEFQKAINTLNKAMNGLDKLKQSILNNKTEFTQVLPEVASLRQKMFISSIKFRFTIYQLIPRRFRPVPYDPKQNIQEFVKRYVLVDPFMSFDDIYDSTIDESKGIKSMMIEYFEKSQRRGYKNLLLFGPEGSGKTLAVHALANYLKGKVAQLEGIELFKIENFSLEFVKCAFNYMPNKPLIIYIRNIEKMFNNMNNFDFIYDKVCSSKLKNAILIASTSILESQLPKEISKKFHYTFCIRPADLKYKHHFIKFIAKKLDLKINFIENELIAFGYENLRNYSNEDIFNLIVKAIDLKKKNYNEGEENMVYADGISVNDLKEALNYVKGKMDENVLKNYYL